MVLDTVETSGVWVERVAGRRAAGRRLARTVDGHARSEGVTVTPGRGPVDPRRSEGPTGPRDHAVSILDTVRRANRPGPPEHSIALRVACAGAVVTGIAACRAEGELTWAVAEGAMVLVAVGMFVSYRTRERPLPWIKPILAAAAVGAFIWFFEQLTGQVVYDVNTVENPLAVLFVWVQVAHAYDVPARRDLAFSLAGSTSLMAVAAAQAIDLGFGLYVAVWLAFGLVGLVAMWGSASAGGRLRARDWPPPWRWWR